MNKTIEFELSEFPVIPDGLRVIPSVNTSSSDFTIDLARLYHHYYLDSWGELLIKPDHTNFEYLRFLDICTDFRFLSSNVSTSTAHKRTISYKMGQAFCRYFLYEFCGITYFAHMDKVLDKKTHPAFNGLQIKRVAKGDVPDYLCAKSVNIPIIAEAKGRFSDISFASKEFSGFRDQFKRIGVFDKLGVPKKVKGYIVATRFTTEFEPRKKSKIYAEDPETDGDTVLPQNEFGLGRGVLAIHYSNLVYKLGLPLIAQSLEDGFAVPNDLQYNLPVWKCTYEPLKDELFIGGFIGDAQPHLQKLENGRIGFRPNILRLDRPTPSFYGLRVDTFRILRKACTGNWSLLSEINPLPDTDSRASNLAWLRDGSITGPLDFFELVGFETF